MKLLKRISVFILCAVMLLGSIPLAQAADNVSFTLIGADKQGNYIVWIPETQYAVNKLSTVGKVLKQAADEHGLTLTGLETDYISAITAPEALGGYKMAEFTNGPNSGWMYTIDGEHPGRSVNNRYLKDGEVLVFHYVNDYLYEVEDWSGGESLGTVEDWNKWLDADDSWLRADEDEEEEQLPPVQDEPEELPEDEAPPAEEEAPETSQPSSSAAAADIDEAIAGLTVSKANAKTRKRLENIRDAYDGLTAEEQAEVTRYEALRDLEKTFGELLDEAVEDAEEDLDDLAKELKKDCTKAQKQDIEDILEEALEDLDDADDTDEVDDIADEAEDDMKKAAGQEADEKEPSEVPDFTDVRASDWFCDDVCFVVEEGLFNGTSDTEFSPNTSMSRAMLVTVLYRMAEASAPAGGSTFSDVEEGQWYTDAVRWAADNGIVSGYGGDTFGVHDLVTREQLAAILYRYAQKQLFDVSVSNDLTLFADYSTISSYAVSALGWANGAGLINGRTETALAPLGTATRAEVAAIIHRFAEAF
ncbi:MAG: S-layer homology domain-containing protein [Oscillospiraceae bacterium]|nr:S-layer homology domain-containing protein [Oscillospiraceae bacterium]